MRTTVVSVLILILLAGGAERASAQQTDEEAVRAVVDRLFDGMRTRDTTMMRSVFAEGAQFYGVPPEGGVRITRPSDFIASIGGAPEDLLIDEVLHDVEIRVDGPLANVWTYYDLFLSDEFSHCGFDAFLLLKDQGEWKIVALADSRRQEGCRRERGDSGPRK